MKKKVKKFLIKLEELEKKKKRLIDNFVVKYIIVIKNMVL